MTRVIRIRTCETCARIVQTVFGAATCGCPTPNEETPAVSDTDPTETEEILRMAGLLQDEYNRIEAANLAKAFSVDTDPDEPAKGTVGYVFSRLDALIDWNEGRARAAGDRYRRTDDAGEREAAMVAEAGHWRAAGDLRFVRETLDDALRH